MFLSTLVELVMDEKGRRMTEGITCYERDEELCEDQWCLRVGCVLRNKRLSQVSPALDQALDCSKKFRALNFEAHRLGVSDD